jgi:hypothetical protein
MMAPFYFVLWCLAFPARALTVLIVFVVVCYVIPPVSNALFFWRSNPEVVDFTDVRFIDGHAASLYHGDDDTRYVSVIRLTVTSTFTRIYRPRALFCYAVGPMPDIKGPIRRLAFTAIPTQFVGDYGRSPVRFSPASRYFGVSEPWEKDIDYVSTRPTDLFGENDSIVCNVYESMQTLIKDIHKKLGINFDDHGAIIGARLDWPALKTNNGVEYTDTRVPSDIGRIIPTVQEQDALGDFGRNPPAVASR